MTEYTKKEQEQINNLGKRIRDLRKKKGYDSHEKFAYEHGISRSQYGRYEKGYNLKFNSLLKILEALDVSLAEFFAEGFE